MKCIENLNFVICNRHLYISFEWDSCLTWYFFWYRYWTKHSNLQKFHNHIICIWQLCRMKWWFPYLLPIHSWFLHSFAPPPFCNMLSLDQLLCFRIAHTFNAIQKVRRYFLAFLVQFLSLSLQQLFLIFLFYCNNYLEFHIVLLKFKTRLPFLRFWFLWILNVYAWLNFQQDSGLYFEFLTNHHK